ncbi:cephalosporin hydroxylase family protein [Rhodopirellula bahusiensis]|uniref:Cephalosporin hydroxylase n=1 Tax=Rhodopirellula bahusiensis TaxID=2014065 RepID=A0A2G1W5D0_9BACT|nr:cephalosporin hydroxylase family protein [Rhodopirellula bahusiensis]PHQ34236.1 cephalosporin hydroxylase [Rhodopirellula bahusiensis]
MTPYEEFKSECDKEVQLQGKSQDLQDATKNWINEANAHKYSYHFEWLGRPIIQYPQDIVAVQELIWATQPELIIETGIAHGGSLILSASLLELNAACGGSQDAKVVGVDIDIRDHNRQAIEDHPMSKRIEMIQGSSIAPEIVAQIAELASGKSRVLVFLDSNHTHDHVLAELKAYAPMTTVGSYCVVFDTIIEDLPEGMFPDRPWGKGDNAKTAVHQYIGDNDNFSIDKTYNDKLLITVAPDGFLKRTK